VKRENDSSEMNVENERLVVPLSLKGSFSVHRQSLRSFHPRPGGNGTRSERSVAQGTTSGVNDDGRG
jgi:hypothetical protein